MSMLSLRLLQPVLKGDTMISKMARLIKNRSESSDLSRSEIISRTETHVRRKLADDSTGHDWYHSDRVRKTAIILAQSEGADEFVVELAALLHDVDDYKFSGSDKAGPAHARKFLKGLGVDDKISAHVSDIISNMSFGGANVADLPQSIEGRCVQDADRLDATGAMGIARTFAYGGYVHRPIYDPQREIELHRSRNDYQKSVGTSVNHFYEKLLLLRDRMTTTAGREIADRRHRYMTNFLHEFMDEWNGRDE